MNEHKLECCSIEYQLQTVGDPTVESDHLTVVLRHVPKPIRLVHKN